jgi:transcriptional regulator with XRE-family HTH domain
MPLKSLRTKAHKSLIAVIVATRKEAGMTQRDLAERMGRQQSFIAKVENGERRLDIIEFIDLAKAMKVDPATLFNRFLRW